MILYVNGDSHSAGWDAGGPEFAYGKHIAQSLNYDYVCDAVAGCSNQSIIERTRAYVKSHCPDFVIIGWSTWERETWYWHGQSYNITASGVDTVPPELADQYKNWVIRQDIPEVQWAQEFSAHDEIWNFHQELETQKIPHLFFNCFSHFFYTTQQNNLRYEWSNMYIDPYDHNMTYYYWLENQGFIPSNPAFYHYGADAHAAWANFLLPKINSVIDSN